MNEEFVNLMLEKVRDFHEVLVERGSISKLRPNGTSIYTDDHQYDREWFDRECEKRKFGVWTDQSYPGDEIHSYFRLVPSELNESLDEINKYLDFKK